jgi:hypothetical protein
MAIVMFVRNFVIDDVVDVKSITGPFYEIGEYFYCCGMLKLSGHRKPTKSSAVPSNFVLKVLLIGKLFKETKQKSLMRKSI